MKNFIITLLLSSFFSNFAFCIEKMPLKTEEELVKELNKKKNLTLEDFEHEHKGCPENSDCSINMGKQRSLWLDLLKTIQKKPNLSNNIAEIEKFRKTHGVPVDFHSIQAAQERFSPILFDSPCPQHNPKKGAGEKVLIASVFVQNTKNNQAHLTVLDTKHDIPFGELAYLDPIYIISTTPAATSLYWVPHGEKPLYIEGESIVLLREHEGFYYGLKISKAGDWQVVEVKPGQRLDEKIEEQACPKNNEILEKYKTSPEYKKYFLDQFCQSIYDISTKSQKSMAVFWSCT